MASGPLRRAGLPPRRFLPSRIRQRGPARLRPAPAPRACSGLVHWPQSPSTTCCAGHERFAVDRRSRRVLAPGWRIGHGPIAAPDVFLIDRRPRRVQHALRQRMRRNLHFELAAPDADFLFDDKPRAQLVVAMRSIPEVVTLP